MTKLNQKLKLVKASLEDIRYMGHLHTINILYISGKEGGGCLLDGDVFLELKVYATKSVTSISET